MSEPAGPTPVVTETPPQPEKAPPERDATKIRRLTRPKDRQARVMIRKVGPWSVLRLSVLFYLCIMVVVLGALVIIYGVLEAIGALDNAEDLISKLFAGDETFEINGQWLFSRALMIGLGMVVVWSLINLFVAFLYNLISDIVGGIEVTLSERR
ncbi:MAG TPA: DUF3566 domain-containing protein [Actinomycetota bacterium]|nr:DUF3566 domain-containing protein [Actinomycetota bacterium]